MKQHSIHPDISCFFPNHDRQLGLPDCDKLEHTTNCFRVDVNMQLKRYNAIIPLFRDACAYEAKYIDSPFLHIDNQTYLKLLQSSRANAIIVSSNYCIPTVEEIYDLQDHVILKCIKKYLMQNGTRVTQTRIIERRLN